MATYYVSPSGSDANNGLGPDASHASNKPWLTIGKALGAAGIASGDTVYIAPGTYRAVVNVQMTSAVAETLVLGDPANAREFKNGSGVLLASGEVICTAYTTSDVAAPSGSAVLTLSGRDFLTFRYLTFVGGTGNSINGGVQTSTNITFRDCCFSHQSISNMITVDGAFGVTMAWLFERCIFHTRRAAIPFSCAADTGSGADYDLDITFRNCLFLGCGVGVELAPSGAGTEKPGGIRVYNCTFQSGDNNQRAISAANASVSTTIPMGIYNCLLFGASIGANTLGQIIEDYNYIFSSTTHTNVTPGANTVTGSNRGPVWNVGEERLYGAQPRMLFEPKPLSWPLTFGNDGTFTTDEDFLGLPRPGGGESAVKGIGHLGRGNTFTAETGTVRTGSTAISIVGPGTQDFQLPVAVGSATVTVYVQWDSTYAGTLPQMIILNGEECGVATDTATAVGSADAWEQLSLTISPTAIGIVTVRFQSNDTDGGGQMFVDDFAVV